MQSTTRLNGTSARAKQTVCALATAGHGVYCQRAIALALSALTGNRISWHALLGLFDMIVAVERNVYGKSLVLNGLVNFCIAHGDGHSAQHQLFNRVLGTLIEKYY
ncbi:hypothetical protein QKQ66_gp138 [Dione juno nucleopolyhedrovirus]|uniref:Uncharacterized protein n=1 Tax=Dione juno nucleopolyhedrovirus TaxID=2594175 RepID=A0AAE6LCA6_9ABAC|nr:hypothetical protein QKQ66_gp138 [Dione juno nucleopolyhedrovirus]QDL57073.1 hypothetical protein DijuNPV-ORF-138 [Dione juno nucleopolyhedrovirus]